MVDATPAVSRVCKAIDRSVKRAREAVTAEGQRSVGQKGGLRQSFQKRAESLERKRGPVPRWLGRATVVSSVRSSNVTPPAEDEDRYLVDEDVLITMAFKRHVARRRQPSPGSRHYTPKSLRNQDTRASAAGDVCVR